MDNLAVANIVQTPVNTSGAANNTASDGATDQGAFGEILAKQIAVVESKPVAASGDGVTNAPQAEILQPIDLLTEIIDPAAFAEQMSASSQVQDTVVENSGELLLGKGKLKASNDDDKPESLEFTILTGDTQDVLGLIQVPGNVSPNLLPSGKDLPLNLDVETGRPVLVPTGLNNNAPQIQVSKDLLAGVVSAGKDSETMQSESFALQLDQALSNQNTKPESGHGNLTVSNSAVTPQVERAVNTLPSSAGIPQQVGSPHWETGLGDRVVWMIGSQTQTAQLHLNPPSLGPLEVRVSMSDGQANLTFMTHQVVVKDAIDAATPRLREMMGEGGVQMGSVSVNVGNFSQQQQQSQQQSGTAMVDRPGVLDSAVPADQPQVSTTLLDDGGLVNLFA